MTKGKAQQTAPLALVFTKRRRYYVIKGRQIDAYGDRSALITTSHRQFQRQCSRSAQPLAAGSQRFVFWIGKPNQGLVARLSKYEMEDFNVLSITLLHRSKFLHEIHFLCR